MTVTTRLQTMRAAENAQPTAAPLVKERVGLERRSTTRPSIEDTLIILREMARLSKSYFTFNSPYQLLLEKEILQEQLVSGPCPGMIYTNSQNIKVDRFDHLDKSQRSVVGHELIIDRDSTSWYVFTERELRSLPHPDDISEIECGVCTNCYNLHANCLNRDNTHEYSYRNWFYHMRTIMDKEGLLDSDEIAIPYDDLYDYYSSSPPDSPDSEGRWFN